MHAHNKVCLPDLRHCCEMFAHAKLKLQGTVVAWKQCKPPCLPLVVMLLKALRGRLG